MSKLYHITVMDNLEWGPEENPPSTFPVAVIWVLCSLVVIGFIASAFV